MSQLLKINNKKYFITIVNKDDQTDDSLLSIWITDFENFHKSQMTKKDAIEKAKALNQQHELENDQIILDIISIPSNTVELKDDNLKFIYKTSGVLFKFEWTLTQVSSNSFIFCLMDAIFRLKKQIDEFRMLPNSDPATLDQLPKYDGFDIANMVMNHNIFDELSTQCASVVKVQTESSQMDVSNGGSPNKPRGTLGNQLNAVKGRNGIGKLTYKAHRSVFGLRRKIEPDSSQEDPPEPSAKVIVVQIEEPNSKRIKSNTSVSKTGIRTKLNL